MQGLQEAAALDLRGLFLEPWVPATIAVGGGLCQPAGNRVQWETVCPRFLCAVEKGMVGRRHLPFGVVSGSQPAPL